MQQNNIGSLYNTRHQYKYHNVPVVRCCTFYYCCTSTLYSIVILVRHGTVWTTIESSFANDCMLDGGPINHSHRSLRCQRHCGFQTSWEKIMGVAMLERAKKTSTRWPLPPKISKATQTGITMSDILWKNAKWLNCYSNNELHKL